MGNARQKPSSASYTNDTATDAYSGTTKSFSADAGNIVPGQGRFPEPILRMFTSIRDWIDNIGIAHGDETDWRINAEYVEYDDEVSLIEKLNPTGMVQWFAMSTPPSGWLACTGQAVSRETYSDLYAAIGTTYGSGDGSTTFNVPDLRGKVAVMMNDSDTDFDTMGETGGAKSVALTKENMPNDADFRGVDANTTVSSGSGIYYGTSAARLAFGVGGGTAHSNLQPYITLYACIKA